MPPSLTVIPPEATVKPVSRMVTPPEIVAPPLPWREPSCPITRVVSPMAFCTPSGFCTLTGIFHLMLMLGSKVAVTNVTITPSSPIGIATSAATGTPDSTYAAGHITRALTLYTSETHFLHPNVALPSSPTSARTSYLPFSCPVYTPLGTKSF